MSLVNKIIQGGSANECLCTYFLFLCVPLCYFVPDRSKICCYLVSNLLLSFFKCFSLQAQITLTYFTLNHGFLLSKCFFQASHVQVALQSQFHIQAIILNSIGGTAIQEYIVQVGKLIGLSNIRFICRISQS